MEFTRCLFLISICLALVSMNHGTLHEKTIRVPKLSRIPFLPLISIGAEVIAKALKQNDTRATSTSRQDPDEGLQTLQAPAFLTDSAGFGMEIRLGSAAESLNVSIALNSELVWVQCPPNCVNCTKPPFHPASSTSYSQLPCNAPLCNISHEAPTGSLFCDRNSCRYNLSNTSSGHYSKDTLSITSPKGIKRTIGIGFGCAQDEFSVLEYEGTSGIAGFNKGANSFISELSDHYTSKFAYCVPSGQDNGTIVIGNYHLENTSSFLYTPMLLTTSQFYYVGLQSIMLGEERITVVQDYNHIDETGGTIIDSTILFTYLVQSSFDPLMEAFRRALVNFSGTPVNNTDAEYLGLTLCYNVSVNAEVYPPTPDLSFNFENSTTMTLTSDQIWVSVYSDDHDDGNQTLCVAIGSAAKVAVNFNLFGTYHQLDMPVEFDLVNSRFGFGPLGKCSSNMKLLIMSSAASRELSIVMLLLLVVWI